jgi:hypothetical protein
MSVGELKFDVAELCHLVILPVLPLSEREVLFVPVQTEAVEGDMEPPADAASTEIVADELFADEQTPLVTTAL